MGEIICGILKSSGVSVTNDILFKYLLSYNLIIELNHNYLKLNYNT